MSRYFLKTFFMYARQIPVQTKVHFKKLYFLAVTYGMKFLSRAFDVVQTAVSSPSVYSITRNRNDLESTNYGKRMNWQESES